MDTSYTAVEYFLSFFGSWRDGQDPAVLSLTTKAPAPTNDNPIHSSEHDELEKGHGSMGSEANMDFRRSQAVCLFSWFFCSHALRFRKPDGRQRAMCILGLSAESYLR